MSTSTAPPPSAPADDAEAANGAQSRGSVLDRDVQQVVNALWAAGAEAQAVNAIAVTNTTAAARRRGRRRPRRISTSCQFDAHAVGDEHLVADVTRTGGLP